MNEDPNLVVRQPNVISFQNLDKTSLVFSPHTAKDSKSDTLLRSETCSDTLRLSCHNFNGLCPAMTWQTYTGDKYNLPTALVVHRPPHPRSVYATLLD